MVQLQADLNKFEKYKLQLVGVSYDNVDVLKKFSDKKSIAFPLLSDEGSQVIRDLGLEFKQGLPHPGTIVVDRQGVVRGKIFKKGYVNRHTTTDLLDLMATLDLDASDSLPAADKKKADAAGSGQASEPQSGENSDGQSDKQR